MKSFLFRLIFVSAFAFVFTHSANSQQNPKPRTGSAILRGTIYDISGAVIPKTKIVFQSNLDESFSAESDQDGIFSISLPFNLIVLSSSKADSQTLKYKIIVDLTDRGFQKKVIDDFSFVSPLKGKMILDIALDSLDPEPCGYAGEDCFPAEPIEIKKSEVKITDKISPQPWIKANVESNQKKKN